MSHEIPSYRCDILVNVASAEDAGLSEWVHTLTSGLAHLVSQKLGIRDAARIVDRGVLEELSSDLQGGVHRCLLVVLTREHKNEPRCQSELDAFLTGLDGDDRFTSVFVLLVDDLDRSEWPESLQRHLGTGFVGPRDAGSEPESGASRQRLTARDKLYHVRLDDLSTALANSVLRSLDHGDRRGGNRPSSWARVVPRSSRIAIASTATSCRRDSGSCRRAFTRFRKVSSSSRRFTIFNDRISLSKC